MPALRPLDTVSVEIIGPTGSNGVLENFTITQDLTKLYVTLHGAFDEIRIITVSTVPTPGAVALLGLGGVLMAGRRRRS